MGCKGGSRRLRWSCNSELRSVRAVWAEGAAWAQAECRTTFVWGGPRLWVSQEMRWRRQEGRMWGQGRQPVWRRTGLLYASWSSRDWNEATSWNTTGPWGPLGQTAHPAAWTQRSEGTGQVCLGHALESPSPGVEMVTEKTRTCKR